MRYLTGLKLIAGLALATTVGMISPAQAAKMFKADINAAQVVSGGGSSSTATGVATLTLNDTQDRLDYTIQLFGLDLEPDPAQRLDPEDVNKIHFHFGVPGTTGPHVLNIFGLPSEDDADLVVDFDSETLTGSWDDGDAFGDPNSPGTTKPLSSFVDELIAGDLYVAIHTVGKNGDVEIRGQITPVPEPHGILGTAIVLGLGALSLKRK